MKIFIDEIMSSESLAQMFKGLSTFMPLIGSQMKEIREKKLDAQEGQAVNPKTGKVGMFRSVPLCILKIFACCVRPVLFPGTVPLLPTADVLAMHPDSETADGVHALQRPADFVLMYDYACGALQTVRARMRRMKKDGHEVPESFWSWTRSCKLLVDKFHM